MSSPTLALIPAKRRSTGVPDKNFKPIAPDGKSCSDLAIYVGARACDRLVFSSDMAVASDPPKLLAVERPDELCQDDTPMIDVVKHALAAVPGPPDEIIVLLQPSSPLRTVETVKKAIVMLDASDFVNSVVSVSPSYPIDWSLIVEGGFLGTCLDADWPQSTYLGFMPSRRQDCTPTYKRDGAVYCFPRRLVETQGNIYGIAPIPLYTPPDEALSIDTQADWDEAVRRLKERKCY